MLWATNSLPLPPSPVTRTVASVGATFSIMRYTSRIFGEAPYMRPNRSTAGDEDRTQRSIGPQPRPRCRRSRRRAVVPLLHAVVAKCLTRLGVLFPGRHRMGGVA